MKTKNMRTDKIKDAIKHYDYVSNDRYQVMQKLLEDGYSEEDIISEFDKHTFKPKWKGNPLGIPMILLAIVIYFSMRETFGMFNYSLDSSGDFFRLNEWVIKPFVLICLLFIGVNITVNKGYINISVKIILIVVFSIMVIVSLLANSPFSALLGILSIVTFALCKMPVNKIGSDASMIIESIKNGGIDKLRILKIIVGSDCKSWNGTALFIGLLFSLCLIVISPVEMSTEFVRNIFIVQEIETIDIVLSYGLNGLFFMNFIGAILININLRKFKWYLVILLLFSLSIVVIGLIHPKFQISIIPALVSLLTSITALIMIFRGRTTL